MIRFNLKCRIVALFIEMAIDLLCGDKYAVTNNVERKFVHTIKIVP